MLKYCDEDGIEKTIIDNENINDYVQNSGSGSGVSNEWKESIEGSISSHSNSIKSIEGSISSHSNSIKSLNNSVNSLNARQNVRIGLNGSILYINW